MTISLFRVFMSEAARKAAYEVLGSGYLTQGKNVEAAEAALRSYLGVSNINTVNSCTSALQLAYKLVGIDSSSYVITTPMTCAATCTAIKALGGNIIWADIDPSTGNIEPHSIEDRLERYGKLPIK